jgi:hypothetical protein
VRAERWLLGVVLVLAAGWRFAGIEHHVVRGAADFDEQNNFLRPIERMAREGSLDPTVYQGYPGFFNWLAAGPVWLGRSLAGYTGATVAGRATVAAFGVLSVLLAFLVARRMAGPWGGLFAAALLAVSRLETRAAHHITPDVLVGTATLATLLLVAREARGAAPSARRDLAIGALAGVAAAVKFSGLLAGVPGAAAALLSGPLLKRGLRMGLAALLAFGLAAPYAVPELLERGGKLTGLTHYYGERAERNQEARGGASGLAAALPGILDSVGPVGVLLAAGSLWLVRPRRAPLPAAATLATSLAILVPAAFVYPRHLVPPGALLAVLAGAGFGALLARAGPRAAPFGLSLAALCLPFQASDSVRLVARYVRPAAIDRAADWIEAHVSGPALVLAALPRVAIDSRRFEVRRTARLQDVPAAVAAQYDLLVTDITRDAAALDGFRTLVRFDSEEGLAERTLSVLAPGRRPRLAPVEPASVTRQGGIQIALPAPTRVFRVEAEARWWPRDARLEAPGPDGAWARVRAEQLRPTERDRRRAGSRNGQIYVLRGEPIEALRIAGRRPARWSQARLRLLALAEDEPLPEMPELERPDRRRQRRR